jgi:hypothetical protein
MMKGSDRPSHNLIRAMTVSQEFRSTRPVERWRAGLRVLFFVGLAAGVFVDESTANAAITIDRSVARATSPELGGRMRPLFLLEREMLFLAELNAREGGAGTEDANDYLVSTIEEEVANHMLAGLLRERGIDPPDLPSERRAIREDFERTLGGKKGLEDLQAKHGISQEELGTIAARRVRARFYVDKYMESFLNPTESVLFQSFRGSTHPYRAEPFEASKEKFARYYFATRHRTISLDYLRSARNRLRLTFLRGLGRDQTQSSVGRVDSPKLAPVRKPNQGTLTP